MAKTRKPKSKERGNKLTSSPKRAESAKVKPNATGGSSEAQSEQEAEWTPARMVEALKAGTPKEKLERLKRAGILTEEGKLAPLYKSWGDKVSRTPDINEAGELQP